MAIFVGDQEYLSLGNNIYQNKKTGKKYRAEVICIDHGYSLPDKAGSGNKNSIILSRFAYAIWGKDISDDILGAIKKLKYSSFQQKLGKLLDKESIELFNKRINDLLRGYAQIRGYKVVKKKEDRDVSEKEK